MGRESPSYHTAQKTTYWLATLGLSPGLGAAKTSGKGQGALLL